MATDAPLLGRGRGIALGLGLLAVAAVALLPFRDDLDTATVALVLLLPGIAAAVVGGRTAALVTGVAAAVVLNVGFLEPYGTLKVDVADEAIDLAVFVGVALLAGALVARERERRHAAEERAATIEALDAENDEIRTQQHRLEAETMAMGLAGEHRRALLRSVSHDLRTPLAAIGAVISDLRSGDEGLAVDEAEMLDLVADEVDRLDRLVGNLLSMSRIEAGTLEPERQAIAVEELLEECVRRHARLVRDRKVAFDVPLTLPLVDADWTLLDQVVTNLLANAVRHAPTGTRVDVAARRDGDERVAISVSDEGPGIPAELRDEVFTPFRRGPGSTSSGVGLAIAKAIVEAHGGEIAIGDSRSGGARVEFTLPVHGA